MLVSIKIIMGIVVLLTRDPQNDDHLIAKQTNFCSRQNCKFLLNLITNVIAWFCNNQFGLYYQIMIDCLAN